MLECEEILIDARDIFGIPQLFELPHSFRRNRGHNAQSWRPPGFVWEETCTLQMFRSLAVVMSGGYC